MNTYIAKRLISLPRQTKLIIVVAFDAVLLVVILLASFSLRLESWYLPPYDLLWIILVAPVLAIAIFIKFDLYKNLVRFIGFKALWSIAQATSLYALLWGFVAFMSAAEGIPRSVFLINWLFITLAVSASRIAARWALNNFKFVNKKNKLTKAKNIVIYGAGFAGRQLSLALMQTAEYNVKAFIDDASELRGKIINDVRVYSIEDFDFLIKQKSIAEVLIAIPSASRVRKNEIINFLEPYSILVRLLPGVAEIASGKVKIDDLREISVKDLLGRDYVTANKKLLSLNIADKVVMVTGAGGSIGAELCRQILFLKPKKLILFELNEFALYIIDKTLSTINEANIKILPMLGSVNNKDLLAHIFRSFKVQTVYHAAAYKHVPLVELNNIEGVSNNILGTLNCAQTAISENVKIFVLISTDKAVRPTNTMGATKRFSEIVLQALAKKQVNTIFSIVRFGNVLDSSGSVIPLFKKQIKDGGPVTVTDLRVTRYFMTIAEAVELVIQAGVMSVGGDVFVLDMGTPVSIAALAKKMIRLSGLEVKDKNNPNGDIEIKYTGLRPGEKLYEELFISNNAFKTSNPMIMRAKEDTLIWDEIKLVIDSLNIAITNCDQSAIRKLLIKVVPEFKPENKIDDILYNTLK